MSILITGGAGFIGRHTAKLFEASGLDVVLLDNLTTGSYDSRSCGQFVFGDIADVPLVRQVTSRARRLLGWTPAASGLESIVGSVLSSCEIRAKCA